MGEFLSLLSGLNFAASNVSTRRGVYFARESFSPLPISMAVGILMFLTAVIVSGTAGKLGLLSWWGIFALSAAGIIHFVFGRGFNYISLRLIGANRTSPLMATNVLFATGFAFLFLREAVTPIQAMGVSTVFLGLILIGSSGGGGTGEAKLARKDLVKGLAAGLACGLCYGISPLFVRVGVREIGSPYAGGLVSYLAAGLLVAFFLGKPGNRHCLARLPRPAFLPILIGGLTVGLAQVLRYMALDFTPVAIVTPLTATNSIFVPFLSWLVNRKMEAFSIRVLGGTAAAIGGVFLILRS
ncbi:MAG: DMT family transporter [Chloroflexi bacterium]|nr:DMT family transporter [Chloroflexota bacterium]